MRMSWIQENWLPLSVVGGILGISWYAGNKFEQAESYRAEGEVRTWTFLWQGFGGNSVRAASREEAIAKIIEQYGDPQDITRSRHLKARFDTLTDDPVENRRRRDNWDSLARAETFKADEEDMVSCNHCWNKIGTEKQLYEEETIDYEMANGEVVCVPCYKRWMEEYENDLDPHYSPFYAESFNADDWEYTDEWYDSALPKIAKRVNEELIADSEMDDEMYSLYEDELFDGDSQTLIPYVDNALKNEYPELTKHQRDEIINEGSMVGDLSYYYDFNAETFNADEGIWNNASKEQRLKWLKDAIPSIGDKYADYTWRELTPRLQDEMGDESYGVETFAAYASAQLTARIRKELKEAFPNLKFSVTKKDGSVNIALMEGDIDFNDLYDDIPLNNRFWERWGNPKPVFKVDESLNHHHFDIYNPKYTALFEKVLSIVKGDEWYDKSDAQIDYFDTAYYIRMGIGKWNKPYKYKPTIKKGTRPTLESIVYKQGYGDDALTGLKGAYDAETFNAVAVAPVVPKTPVEKVLMNQYLMNRVAREELMKALQQDLVLHGKGYRPDFAERYASEEQEEDYASEYDNRLKREFGE